MVNTSRILIYNSCNHYPLGYYYKQMLSAYNLFDDNFPVHMRFNFMKKTTLCSCCSFKNKIVISSLWCYIIVNIVRCIWRIAHCVWVIICDVWSYRGVFVTAMVMDIVACQTGILTQFSVLWYVCKYGLSS